MQLYAIYFEYIAYMHTRQQSEPLHCLEWIEVYTAHMEGIYAIHLKISKVENSQYLAESDDIPGLVAQGRTIPETVEIAQDVAKKLIESYSKHGYPIPSSLKPLSDRVENDMAVGV